MSEAHDWLVSEDEGTRAERADRLAWLAEAYPGGPHGLLVNGGWLSKQLLEEVKYCFTYGQYVATAVLGYALIERLLAAELYAQGRDELERAPSERLIIAARDHKMISDTEYDVLNGIRSFRNPLLHFRRPFSDGTIESRWRNEEQHPENFLEADARTVITAAFRLLARHAV
jgi:hypothetical protein